MPTNTPGSTPGCTPDHPPEQRPEQRPEQARGSASNMAARHQYIVRARNEQEAPAALAAFLSSVASDPDIELVDTIGPAGMPHTAVLAVVPEHAPALEQCVRNSQHLMIEPDRPLSLYGDDASARSERNTNA